MNDSSDTKVCPMCAETIKSAAKVCPCCGSRQRRSGFLKGELAGILVVIPLAAIIIMYLVWRFPDDSKEASLRSFALHRRDLIVVRDTLEFGGSRQNVWLTGYVTNRGDRPWRVHELELRILNTQGNMTDVQHPDFKKSDAFVVEPGHEHAFRIQFDTRTSTNTSMTLAVRVQNASDGKERYDPD